MTRKKLLIAAAVVIIILIALIAFLLLRPKVSSPRESSPSNSTTTSAVPLNFTAKIFDPSTVAFIGPVGELNGGYEETQTIAGVLINLKPEVVANGKEITVYAPADMSLERYAFFNVPRETGVTNWSLTFRFNERVTMRVDHLTNVPEKIKKATGAVAKDSSSEDFLQRPLSFKAGEPIAFTSGTSLAKNWNIYIYDKGVENKFVKQERYRLDEVGQRLINASCIFDYYPESEKRAFLALMGYSKAGQSATCGSVSRDKAGTLSGMWHLATGGGTKVGRDGNFVTPISIYKTSANTIIIAQIGDERFEIAQNNPTYKDPMEITTEHCYLLFNQNNQPSGYAFFKIVSEKEMTFTHTSSGSCPSTFPTSKAKSYYR